MEQMSTLSFPAHRLQDAAGNAQSCINACRGACDVGILQLALRLQHTCVYDCI